MSTYLYRKDFILMKDADWKANHLDIDVFIDVISKRTQWTVLLA